MHTLPDAALLARIDVLVMCNPNNPTGQYFSTTQLLAWHAQLAEHDGWLVVDEAFIDATPEQSLAHHSHLDGLFVLRSLGKFFGLAGARVGFVLAAEAALSGLQTLLGPWALTGASRLIARQALMDHDWQQQSRKTLLQASQRLAQLLTRQALTPMAGTALYQWVPTEQAILWQQHLARHGVWVRLLVEPKALRFGLPTQDGWEKLENALKSAMQAVATIERQINQGRIMGQVVEVEKDMTKIKQGVLLHGCNTKGVMGMGGALALRSAFPSIFPPYKSYCQIAQKMGRNILGRVIEVQIGDQDLYVISGLTQLDYGVDGKVYADIDAIKKVVNHSAEFAGFLKIPLYMPRIGCGHGGLEWSTILPIVEQAATQYGVEIYICNKPNRGQLDSQLPG